MRGGINGPVRAVRTRVGLYSVSHMICNCVMMSKKVNYAKRSVLSAHEFLVHVRKNAHARAQL